MMLAVSLFLFLPKILCGFGLAHWLWKASDSAAIVLKLAVGVPLGFAISSSLFFAALIVGIAPRLYSLVELWGSMILALLIAIRFRRKLPKTAWKFASPSWTIVCGGVVLILAFGVLTYAFLYYSRMHPYGFEDAWSIWNYTPRYLYRTNSADILFHSQFYEPFHPDYPAGMGLNVAWGWFGLGRESTSIPIVVGLYAILTPAVLLLAALRKWRGALPGLLATLVYLMNPNLKWAVGQMADILLAAYLLASMIMLYSYLHSSHSGLMILAGLLSGFAAWIKNEGILFACVFLLLIVLMTWRQIVPRAAAIRLLVGMSLPLLVVIAYKLTVLAPSDLFNDEHSLLAQILDIQRWWMILKEFLVNIIGFGNWPISMMLVLVLYGLLVGLDHSEGSYPVWLLLLIAGQFAGYFGIYLITPHDLDWHLSTSVDRVITHLFPMGLFWVFLILQPPILVPYHKSPA